MYLRCRRGMDGISGGPTGYLRPDSSLAPSRIANAIIFSQFYIRSKPNNNNAWSRVLFLKFCHKRLPTWKPFCSLHECVCERERECVCEREREKEREGWLQIPSPPWLHLYRSANWQQGSCSPPFQLDSSNSTGQQSRRLLTIQFFNSTENEPKSKHCMYLFENIHKKVKNNTACPGILVHCSVYYEKRHTVLNYTPLYQYPSKENWV